MAETDALKKFSYEATGHQNIIKLVDIFEESGQTSFVMEYCEGGDLRDKINSTNLTMQEVEAYTRQLLSGVEHLYESRTSVELTCLFADD